MLSRKHEAARANLKRLGLQAQFVTHDLTQPLDVPKSNFVLLDAPCIDLVLKQYESMLPGQVALLPDASPSPSPPGVLPPRREP